MEKIEITKEMILAAGDYMADAAKEEWASANSAKCFDRLAITADKDPLPPMYMVNMGLRSRYLMTVFVAAYLRQPYATDPADDALMSAEDYDKWAGSHVFCQMERLKRDLEIKDKCYDILYDFHELEKRFSAQINGLLAVQNDAVVRQNQLMAAQVQAMPQIIEQLKSLQEAKENGADTAD